MVFKRRDPRPWLRIVAEFFYPRGGWRRAASYIYHRISRLPDAPHRIARGIFAGIFVSFTPLFGFHFLLAALIGWLIRANILASLFATFLGNPLTFPFIATSAMETGSWLLGIPGGMQLPQILDAFGKAGSQLWLNLVAVLTGGDTHWDSLHRFFSRVFLPYLVGGIVPGLVTGIVGYYVSLPLIVAYQKRNEKKKLERLERRRAMRLAAQKAAEAVAWTEMQAAADAAEVAAAAGAALAAGVPAAGDEARPPPAGELPAPANVPEPPPEAGDRRSL